MAFGQKQQQEGYTHIPVVREILADLDTPVSIYVKLANCAYTYLLESVQGGSEWGRYSIIGLPCQEVYRFHGNTFSHECNGAQIHQEEVAAPLAYIDELQQQYCVPSLMGLPEMFGGLVGYFAYESIQYIEPKLQARFAQSDKPDEIGVADITLLLSKDVIVFDNLLGRIYLISLAEIEDKPAYATAIKKIEAWSAALALPLADARSDRMTQLHPSVQNTLDDYRIHFPQEAFKLAVQQCRAYIKNGDIMQVVLSQRLSTKFSGQSFDLYRVLRTINPSPYMFYFDLNGFEIVGSSPEILVKKQAQTVTVHPIAGTRHRGKNADEDARLAEDLLNDKKELAEHLMLIDLGRNDIGKIAKIGSVKLTEKMAIEKYSHVMHIVSNVVGEVDASVKSSEILQATFPAGTVSGAPKFRAMEIIDEFEPYKRGIYSGAIGYMAWNSALDTAIAIRTAVVKDGRLFIQAGAGIVADSIPENEWQETLNKAKAMMSAVQIVKQNAE